MAKESSAGNTHGGSREGSGRPAGSKQQKLSKKFFEDLLDKVGHADRWQELINAKQDPKIVLDALKYATDRVLGKPKEKLDVDADIQGGITVQVGANLPWAARKLKEG